VLRAREHASTPSPSVVFFFGLVVESIKELGGALEENTIKARWHGDVDLEVVPRWHAFAYLCTLLGCYGDVPQTNVDDGDPHDVDMELEGNGALDIYDDALVIAYL
jgi:hypothetical protein